MRTSKLRARALFGFVGILFFGQASFGAPATATLKAVKKNNGAITPTTDVAGAVVGETYEVEVYLCGWNGLIDLARGYQFRIGGVDGAGNGVNNFTGGILPLGWDAPISSIGCTTNNDCLIHAPYVTCQAVGAGGICVGPNHHPEQGAFVTTSRSDFLLAGLTPFGGLGLPNLNYLYGFTAQENDGAFDSGCDITQYYAGTLKLVVKTGACGDYVWRTVDGNDSFLIDETPSANLTPLIGVPLTIHTPPCLSGITATTPPVCSIDARYPNDPNNAATRFGYNTLGLTLSNDPGTLTTASFQMSTAPTGPGVPVISNVQKNGTQVTLTFDRVIPSTRWTCVKALFGEQDTACIGALGADTDASKLSDTPDTLALINALDGTPSLQIWQTDLDRSGKFTPIDILASVDLLNGAGALNFFKGSSLSSCPTAGVPIP